jgi:hypothetical protein
MAYLGSYTPFQHMFWLLLSLPIFTIIPIDAHRGWGLQKIVT